MRQKSGAGLAALPSAVPSSSALLHLLLKAPPDEVDERRRLVVRELLAGEPALALLDLAKHCAEAAGEYAVGLVADVASDMGRTALDAARLRQTLRHLVPSHRRPPP